MSSKIEQHKYLFHRGTNYRSYEFLGAHLCCAGDVDDSCAASSSPASSAVPAVPASPAASADGSVQDGAADDPGKTTGAAVTASDLDPLQPGAVFRVWAPRAKSISVVGSFNDWNGSAHPMKQLEDDSEIWSTFIPGVSKLDQYKFAVTDDKGKTVLKADPYAFFSENGNNDSGSQRASLVYDPNGDYSWNDDKWMQARQKKNFYKSPVNIYEAHAGSWKHHDDDRPYSYRELADNLIPYVSDMGYTHIELMPLTEYPFEGSWGYQVTGYFSPTSRYGLPEDLRYFIDKAHQSGIGIIMDWVPAHFPKDEYGLALFDGHCLYEDSNPLRREHKGWGTLAFDFGRPEVISFLISSAFYLCEQFHIDGLRVDAVAAMIYLNYDRQDGEWMPNVDGGTDNKESIAFLQKMNKVVLTNFPGVMTVAEESTAWPNITKPPEVGGLGFNFKWNMGWMNDELQYFSTDPYFRKGSHHNLVFSLDYAWSENYILPISHDEVVHGKKSLLDKMPGDYDEKFHGLRTFLTYMFTHPGKKLTFMGTELAHFSEWSEARQLDWVLLDYDKHRQLHEFVRDLNAYYLKTPSLWNADDDPRGFRWIDGGNIDDNVITFIRYRTVNHRDPLVICLNLSGKDIQEYKVGVPDAARYITDIDTDLAKYGGKGIRTAGSYPVLKGKWNGFRQHIELSLPALSAIVLRREK